MDIFWDFALRLFVAGAMGVLIGLEREYRAKEAGYRTHFLVAVGSALMMIVSPLFKFILPLHKFLKVRCIVIYIIAKISPFF